MPRLTTSALATVAPGTALGGCATGYDIGATGDGCIFGQDGSGNLWIGGDFNFAQASAAFHFDGELLQPSIAKSTDGGITWTELDDADAPVIEQDRAGETLVFDPAHNTIHLVQIGSNPGGGGGTLGYYLAYTPFHMLTGLWGGTVLQNFNVNGPGSIGSFNDPVSGNIGLTAIPVLRSNGDLIVFVILNDAPNSNDLAYFVISGGVFSGPTTLVTGGVTRGLAVGIDSSDNVSILFQQYGAGALPWYFLSLSSSYVAGTPSHIAAMDAFETSISGVNSRLTIWNSLIVVGWTNVEESGAISARLLTGSPATAPTSWSVVNLDPTVVPGVSDSNPFLTIGGSTLYAAWTPTADISGAAAGTLIVQTSTQNGSTFAPNNAYWNAATDPVPGVSSPPQPISVFAPLGLWYQGQLARIAFTATNNTPTVINATNYNTQAFVFFGASIKKCLLASITPSLGGA